MQDVATVIADLPARKRALLVAQNPLSFGQERLWFLDQLIGGGATFNLPSALLLEGDLDIRALQRSLEEIVHRHEILRTTFLAPDGQVMQVIHPAMAVPLPVLDLSLPGEEKWTAARRAADEEIRQPFDLSRGPLLRCRLLRLGNREHLLVMTLHHIISDGWSMEVLIRELTALYVAYSRGSEPSLPPLPIQYLDFARWQRGWLRGEVLEGHLEYWKRQLAGSPPVLDLPADRPRLKVRTYHGARCSTRLPATTTEALKRLAHESEVTLFTALLTAFTALLARLSGQWDVVTGSPIANRTREETEPLIGLFINLLVLRVDLGDDPPFTAALQRVRQTVIDAQAHQDLPFEKLVEELQPERNLQHAPLVQVVFVLLLTPPQELELPGLSLRHVELDAVGSQYDATLSMVETPEGLAARLEYSTDLFEAATAQRLLHGFETLLAGVVADPGRHLSDLPLLTPAEREQILREWGSGGPSDAPDLPLHRWLERQTGLTPAAEAVRYGEASLTYRELNARANRLARVLRRLGVGVETLVALHLERSLDMVVALWGVLKAGGAYLPLDPDYPQERLAWMLEDSSAAVVLTQERLLPRLPAHAEKSSTVLVLDAETTALAGEDPCNLEESAGFALDRLAYVLYTSGSTGRPKGVQVTHRGVVNFLVAMERKLGFGEGDTLLAVTTLSFDISVLELVLPALAGARAVIAGPGEASDGRRLAELLSRHNVTAMQATPATWQMLLESGWQGSSGLEILCGGEALSPELACHLFAAGAAVWNLYGPTETTIWSAVQRVTAEPGPVPIGRPIVATDVRIVGSRFELQPPRSAGELCIGGAGVARGYLHRPDLTAERFVPDPWGGPGARLYRTGDLARFRAGGTLEFLGRIDHQVKLRGHRIEPGEIESLLLGHPEVREAVVVVREDQPGDRRLAAYVVPAAGSDRPEMGAALRRSLEERLPGYMVPAFIVSLPALPLTPSGKVDRRALPAPDPTAAEAGRTVEPRTPLEAQVAGIWAGVLGVERVGVDSSFFELGGHSLSAARMMHQLRVAVQVDLPLAQLFETPTVAGLAGAIARRKAELAAEAADLHRLPAIVPDPENRYEPFPLNDVQQAYWVGRASFFALGNVASHSYTEIEILDLDLDRLTRALRRLIARHDMLRAVVQPEGLQRILPEVPPYEVEVLDLRQRSAAEAAAALEAVREAMSHQVRPTDRWPLFEVRASLLEERRARIHFSLDYLIADAWSVGIIFREVLQLYAAPSRAMEPLHLSFRDWVLAEKRLEETELFRRAEEYWRGRLADLPPAPELPLARNPQTLERPRFVRRTSILEAPDWQRLRQRAARFGLTPSGLLLGAFSEILALWSRSPRFTLNVTLFNRPPLHPQIDDIVGDFTTLSLLVVDASVAGSFVLRARAVQEQLWQDMEHQAVSAIRVLRELARTAGRAPDTVMPVVFTSALGQHRPSAPAGQDGRAESGQVYGISQTPQVWLDHQVVERDGVLVFNWDAVEELFPEGLLDDAFTSYRRFLDDLLTTEDWLSVERPPRPAWQVEMQRRVNATGAPVSGETLHGLFAARAAEQPYQPALIAPERTLSYGELDHLTDRLAQWLRREGVRQGELVAVAMEKGWEQIAAALAVLKAGAAYLPIDPSVPARRLALLLEQGEVRIVLVQPWLEADVEWPEGIERLQVSTELPDGLPAAPLERLVQSQDLAYVIYTSGSTGDPKGVMIDHRGAVNTILDINERFGVGPLDRVLAVSAFNFDLSVYDAFGLLAAGGAIVIPAAANVYNPDHWAELIERHQVTLWNSVPALMDMLLSGEAVQAAGRLRSLRLAMLSGDWLPVQQPDQLRGMVDAVEVASLGGATEASIWSTLYPIGKVDPAWRSIPYGRPMRNQTFHVLDHALEPRPVWVPGELFIGGIGLALGYWRDGEKTAERFFEHPGTGERLYRTGDLGRWLPDGNIEFLGREDFQVKIRGHRIELGEIEAALQQIEEVQAAVVEAVGQGHDDRRLVAYVVLRQETPSEPEASQVSPAGDLAVAGALEPQPQLPILGDEIANLDFKLREPGLRRDLAGRPSVELREPEADERERYLAPFVERRTYREFSPDPVPLPAFGRALACLAKEQGDWKLASRRHYLAAADGPRVETLVWIKTGRLEGLSAGIYRYHPDGHRLEAVADGVDLDSRAFAAVNHPVVEQAAFAVLLAGPGAGRPSGSPDVERDAALIEAGSIGQRLMEEAPVSDIGFCPIGTIDLGGEGMYRSLGLGGFREPLHSLLGGMVVKPCGAAVRSVPVSRPSQAKLTLPFGNGDGDPPRVYEYRNPREFLRRAVSLDRLGDLLGGLRQVRIPQFPLPKYRYPSAGNLYPVQVYLHVQPGGVEGLEPGVYYYHPKDHRLVLLSPAEEIASGVYAAADRDALDRSAFSILLVSRPSAIVPVYGDLARDFCLLEAGYLTQLLGTLATEVGIGLWPLSTPGAAAWRGALGLEPHQTPLQCLAAGPVPVEAVDALPQVDLSAPASLFAEIAAAMSSSLDRNAGLSTAGEREEIVARLHGALGQMLPEYMLPSQFVFLEALPLTPNGKVDRKALPVPETVADAPAAEFVAPRSDLERLLAQVWRDILGRQDFGVNDNFFSLGGNSLHMVRIRTQLQEGLGREVPITDFFKYPTIASLAAALSGAEQETEVQLDEIRTMAQRQKEALRQRGRERRRLEENG